MIDVLLYVLGILIMLVGIGLSIGLHEIGHLIPAKLFKVKVTQYMIGFGKTLWSKKKGETEYGVKMIPLGGYVAMTGMYPPQKPGEAPRASTTGFLNTVMQEGAPGKAHGSVESSHADVVTEIERFGDPAAQESSQIENRAGNEEPEIRRGLAGMVDDARLASAETIEAGEEHRTFYRLPVWKKIIIMLGGPIMNLVLAFVFFGIVLVGFGTPQNTTVLGSVSECLIPAGSTATTCGPDDPAAPAAAAGLRPGDRVLAVDGETIRSWEQFQAVVAGAPGRTLDVAISRDGTEQTLQLTPRANERVVYDDEGAPVLDDAGVPMTRAVGMVGVIPAQENVSEPITSVPSYVGDNVARVVGVVVHLPQRMIDTWNAAFGAEERDPNGPMSMVGVGRLAGEVVSLDAPIESKAAFLVSLLGSLNVALFVFNLIPLMPLDGGHVAGALYEGIKRGFARIRRKPDPGPIDTAKMVPVTFVVVIVLGAMSLLLAYADIVKPVNLFG